MKCFLKHLSHLTSRNHTLIFLFFSPWLLLFRLFYCFLLIFLTSGHYKGQGSMLGPLFISTCTEFLGDLIQFQGLDAVSKLMMPIFICSSSDILMAHFITSFRPWLKFHLTDRCSHTITLYSLTLFYFLLSIFLHLSYIYLCIESLLRTGELSTL